MSGSAKQSRQPLQSLPSASRTTNSQDQKPYTIIDALQATVPDTTTSTNPIQSTSRHRSSHSTTHNHHHHHHHHHHHSSHTHTHTHRNDAERMRKKFRDAIYVGNFERVALKNKNIIHNETLY
eukprot:512034_1